MKLLKSTAIFSAMTLLSRVTGYARDLVQSSVFGVSWRTDAFLIAYRIPNFLRRIFAEGSFAQAFVPVFTQMRQRGDDAAVKDLLDHVAGALCGVVLLVTAIGMLAAPAIAALFAPGSLDEPQKFELISSLLRITFPYLWFVSVTALAAGVLNSMGRFALPAVTPVLFNLAAIAAAIWLAPHLKVPIAALAWGVVGAGFLQLAVQWGALAKLGVLPRLRLNLRHDGVRRVFRLMLPTIFGSSVAQINLLVGTVFASLLATGSQTWLYLSDRLLEFPQGMFGVALGTVILPSLSRRHAADDAAGFAATLDWGLRMAVLVALPATIGLVVLAEPINATLYQHGQFSAYDTKMAALSLAGLAVGLPAFMLAKVLAPAFYARQDTRTPVRAAVITVVVNVVLCTAIVAPLWWHRIEGAHAGIAVATALAGTVNAGLLWRYVRRQGLYTPQPGWGRFWLRVVAANVAMIAVLLAALHVQDAFTLMPTGRRVVGLVATIAAGAGVYATMLVALGLRRRHLREHAEPPPPAAGA